jgi:hypothetical protein
MTPLLAHVLRPARAESMLRRDDLETEQESAHRIFGAAHDQRAFSTAT